MMVHRIRSLAAALLLAATPGPGAVSAHPLLTDNTDTQGKGKYQIEVNGSWIMDRSGESGTQTREIDVIAALVLTGGIAPSLDLIVGLPYAWTTTAGTETERRHGILDMPVEAKWRFWEAKDIALAVKPGFLLPTGDADRGFGTGKVGYYGTLIAGFEREPWHVDLNASYYHLENRTDQHASIWSGSLSTRYEVTEQWTIAGEVGAARNASRQDSTWPAFAQAGLIYSPVKSFDLGVGLLMGLNDAEVDEAVRFGLTMRF